MRGLFRENEYMKLLYDLHWNLMYLVINVYI